MVVQLSTKKCQGKNAVNLKTLANQFPNPKEWENAMLVSLGGDCPRNNFAVNPRNNGGTGVTSGSGGTNKYVKVKLTTTSKKPDFIESAFVTDSPSDPRDKSGDVDGKYEGFEVKYIAYIPVKKPQGYINGQAISVQISEKDKSIFHTKQFLLNPPFPKSDPFLIDIYQIQIDIKTKKKIDTITFKIPRTSKYMTIKFKKATKKVGLGC